MMKKETRIIYILLVLISIMPLSVGSALAADESEGLKFSTDILTGGDLSFSDVEPLKPLAAIVIVFILFAWGVTAVAGLGASGIKGNISTILRNNDLRNEGLKGHINIVGGLFMMCLALLAVGIIWNSYGPGSW